MTDLSSPSANCAEVLITNNITTNDVDPANVTNNNDPANATTNVTNEVKLFDLPESSKSSLV